MPNLIEAAKKGGKWVAVGVTAMAVSAPSFALDTVVTDAMGQSTADMTTAGGLILVAAATAFGIRWVKATFF